MKALTLAQARQGFEFTKRTENKSTKTVEWYGRMLSRFETFMATRNGTGSPPMAKIKVEDIRAFVADLQGQASIWQDHPYHKPVAHPLSPQTVRGYVRGLSAFFAWALGDGIINANPMERIEKPKVPRTIKEAFRPEEIKRLVDACDQYPATLALRNKAIVLFLLDTGVRAAELVGLTMDALDIPGQRARVFGKGAKDRYVSFGNLTAKALLYYCAERPPANVPDPHVFLTQEGREMTVGTLQLLLRRLGQRAQVPRCGPHRFRHSAARLLLRNGLNVFALQALMGHENLSTTRGYVQMENADLEKAYKRASPVDNFNIK